MNSVECFILKGGASSRMGKDKARLKLGGKSFVELAADAWRQIEPSRLCLIGDGSEGGLEAVPDVWQSGVKASLIGLHTALYHAQTEWVGVLACDMPFVTGELLKYLFSQRNDYDAVLPVQPEGEVQPLCAFYRRAVCLPIAEQMLAAKNWKMQQIRQKINVNLISFEKIKNLPDSKYFFLNVNTPAEFLEAQKVYKNMAAEDNAVIE